MSTLFIADLHLQPEKPATLRAFLSLLAGEAREADALYMLGDLFEAWIGDDDDSPMACQVRESLKRLSATTPVFFMHGNRDFLIGERFAENSGCRLLSDPYRINLYGRPVLLMHGDTLCTEDRKYQQFRQQVRDPAWQAALLAKPLAERQQIAQQLRQASRDSSRYKSEAIMDVTPAEVERVMRQHDVDCLIHGHTHRPACHTEPTGTRIVLGDWEANGWVLRWDARGPELASFPIET